MAKKAPKPKLSIAKPEGPKVEVGVALPNKAPIKFEIALVADESGLKFKDAVGLFTMRFPNDPYCGGAEQSILNIDEKSKALLTELFDVSLNAMIAKHKTCNVEEALKLPKPEVAPSAAPRR